MTPSLDFGKLGRRGRKAKLHCLASVSSPPM
uniref:Uncharacterized protein n=1 Tax=Rhizophora mucronata TaxID=61149 RepID=A0A2P2Q1I5_RHIMU